MCPFQFVAQLDAAAVRLRASAGPHRKRACRLQAFFYGFLNRTGGPPPFSSMNSMPAAPSAWAGNGLDEKVVDGELELAN
jgi:hypothetical protein